MAAPRTQLEISRPETSAVRQVVVGVLFLLASLTIVDRVAVSAAKAAMSRDLGLGDMTFGMVFGAFALGYGVLMVPSGWWADRYGPRRFLAAIVLLWSACTAWTGLISAATVLIAVRFLFGLAEAGAFPAASRAIYQWVPRPERGFALGALNTGSRIGAAFGLAVLPHSIAAFGWRPTFFLLGAVGLVWAAGWLAWFRDDPRAKSGVSERELDRISCERDSSEPVLAAPLDWRAALRCGNVYLILAQYFASNFTFFICFSWLLPYLTSRFQLSPGAAGAYASLPLYFGAVGTWSGGVLVDRIYRRGRWTLSRRLPAMAGFGTAAVMVAAAAWMQSPLSFTVCFAIATFGVDLTLSPSWSTSADVGAHHTGTLSGAMNMAGSVGSFTSSLAFPFLLSLTGDVRAYFCAAAALNLAAVMCWSRIRPDRRMTE